MKLTKQEQDILDGIMVDSLLVGASDNKDTTSNIPKRSSGHHCEDLFNIAPQSTDLVPIFEEREPTPIVRAEEYDDKDAEIDEQYQEIYDVAMGAYDHITDDLRNIGPKFRARSSEVAATFLATALSAVKEKASLKMQKDKLAVATKKVVADANKPAVVLSMGDLIKQMAQANGPASQSLNNQVPQTDPIEGEFESDAPVRKVGRKKKPQD